MADYVGIVLIFQHDDHDVLEEAAAAPRHTALRCSWRGPGPSIAVLHGYDADAFHSHHVAAEANCDGPSMASR
jgi:hypothetical protein